MGVPVKKNHPVSHLILSRWRSSKICSYWMTFKISNLPTCREQFWSNTDLHCSETFLWITKSCPPCCSSSVVIISISSSEGWNQGVLWKGLLSEGFGGVVWGRFCGGMVVGVLVVGAWFWWDWCCFWRMEFSPQPITFMTMQPNKIEIARTIKMMPWTARERCRCGNLRSKIFLTNSTTEHALQGVLTGNQNTITCFRSMLFWLKFNFAKFGLRFWRKTNIFDRSIGIFFWEGRKLHRKYLHAFSGEWEE